VPAHAVAVYQYAPFPPQDRAAGYRYDVSILQAESFDSDLLLLLPRRISPVCEVAHEIGIEMDPALIIHPRYDDPSPQLGYP
jgi:hypothetical protein